MEQFIECECIKRGNGELIPIWELEVMYDKEEDCVKFYDPTTHNWLEFYDKKVKAFYDLVNRTVVGGRKIVKVFDEDKVFVVGDKVLIPTKDSYRDKMLEMVEVIEVSVGKIIYSNYVNESELNLSKYEVIEEIELDGRPGDLVRIDYYRRLYKFSNGSENEFTYDIYKLKE